MINGIWDATIKIPIIQDTFGYHVDGRDFVENKQHLIYKGKTKVMGTTTDNRKERTKKKQLSKAKKA